MKYVTYAHKDAPNGQRYRDMADSPPPEWAVDIREEKGVRTADLIGPALDWAVAKCEGEKYQAETGWDGIGNEYPPHRFSTSWDQGGPIIDREKLSPVWSKLWEQWEIPHPRNAALGILGPTFLIAAMRCYVASKLGDEVEIPEELK